MIFLEYIQAKRMNGRQAAGVDKNIFSVPVMAFQRPDQLAGRQTIEITAELQMKMVAVLMQKYLKIWCHHCTHCMFFGALG